MTPGVLEPDARRCTGPGWTSGVAALLVALFLVPSAPATGFTSPRIGTPTRDLTEKEQLLDAVAGADAIIIARVLAVNTEIVQRSTGHDAGTHFMFTYAMVQVMDVLLERSGAQPRGTKPIHIAGDRVDEFGELARAGATVILFLRKYDAPQRVRTVQDGQLVVEYVKAPQPRALGHGTMQVEPTRAAALVKRMRLTIAQSEPESLAMHSDLVVRGHHEGPASVCRGDGREQICARIVVEEVLLGPKTDGPLQVFAPIPGTVPDSETMFFLRRTPEDSYELVGMSAGAKPIARERVGRGGRKLQSVRRALKQVEEMKRRHAR